MGTGIRAASAAHANAVHEDPERAFDCTLTLSDPQLALPAHSHHPDRFRNSRICLGSNPSAGVPCRAGTGTAYGYGQTDSCFYMSGPDNALTFDAADCASANVYITGRTHVYGDTAFCDGYGWTTWNSEVFPDYSYTICFAWL
jgi:hypothetical protein